MNPVETWRAEAVAKTAVKALQKNGFQAEYCKTADVAIEKAGSFFKSGLAVGFGGSMTVRALGLQDKALAAGCELLDHNAPGLDNDSRMTILRRQLTCDVFICSSNALTLEGELVNVDGNGNRLAALSFGPRKNLVIVGVNKLVRDLDEAFARIEQFAGPMNNKRLDKTNPCVKAGECMDCDGDSRICRIYQILKKRPSLSDFTVLIVGENLGY
ncbi:lactate utilization protein [Spirochaetota bacterium]